MIKTLFVLLLAASFVSCGPGKDKKSAEKKSTEAEVWTYLFDGTSTEGWRNYNKTTFPEQGWEIVDGTLHCIGSGRGEAGGGGGDILYDKKFSNFHLKLEWKISEGGNSGIFYPGTGESELDYIWKTAPEMQVLDNERHPDAQAGKDGNRQAGSLYDLIPAVPQNAKPAGEWNTAEIKVYKGSVWHIQNGETVLEYHLWTPEWNALVAGSKFPALNPNWANVATEGYIGLQDHGDDVWYRNIQIREL
ncbi:MAG: DUF1080 domain-containing protein [Bacteroidales bacterium]